MNVGEKVDPVGIPSKTLERSSILVFMSEDARPVYSFGPFRLEARERRLLRDSEVVPLAGKAFDTLLLLVETAGTPRPFLGCDRRPSPGLRKLAKKG